MTVRACLRLAAAAFWLAVCVSGWWLARPFGRQAGWVRRYLWLLGRILGLRVRIEGSPVTGGVLYVANHTTWLDIIAIGGATETRFIAKSEIAEWPLVGKLAALGASVFVTRDRRGSTRAQADAVVSALGEGRPVTLFAEGGTGDGSIVRPFRPALFASAVEARTPVQPIAVDYGPDRMIYAWPPDTSFSTEAKRMINRVGAVPVTLHFLPPLDGTALDRKTIAARAQVAVAEALA